MFDELYIENLNTGDVLDVDDVVKMWTKSTPNRLQSTNRSSKLHYETHWNKARIEHSTPQFNDVFNPPSPKQQLLFKATYKNDTDCTQENTFRAERSTQSQAELIVREGVCFNQFGVVVPLPNDVASANAGFPSELSVCKQMIGKWKEEMKWSVDNRITVQPGESVTAKLLVEEKQWNGEFSITTKLSGKIRVVIRDDFGNVSSVAGDLQEIFSHAKEAGLNAGNLKVLPDAVQFVTNGKLNFRYGIEQKVVVCRVVSP